MVDGVGSDQLTDLSSYVSIASLEGVSWLDAKVENERLGLPASASDSDRIGRMVELYGCQLLPRDEFTARQEEIITFVPQERRERFLRFRRAQDRQRSMIGELLARKVISDRTGAAKEQIQFEEGEHGKPSLRTFKDLHFSISHSGEWVVNVFSESVVGVDIQQMEMRSLDVARRFFTSEESELILAKPEHDRLSLFYELWTLKESYLKAVGSGIAGSLRAFSMQRDDLGFYAESDGERLPFFFRQYDLHDHYKLAVCSAEPEFSADVQVVTLDDLCTSRQEYE
jgi:4'-phosphopantetheinyl transferase